MKIQIVKGNNTMFNIPIAVCDVYNYDSMFVSCGNRPVTLISSTVLLCCCLL